MIEMRQIYDHLDMRFLSCSDYPDYAYHISYFTSILGIDREFARGYLRSLRQRGLMEYVRGLMNDDGVCGAGYKITVKGETHLNSLNRIKGAHLGAPL